MTGRQGRRRKQLLYYLKVSREYRKLKEEALVMCITRFGRGYGPVIRQTTEWMNGTYKYGRRPHRNWRAARWRSMVEESSGHDTMRHKYRISTTTALWSSNLLWSPEHILWNPKHCGQRKLFIDSFIHSSRSLSYDRSTASSKASSPRSASSFNLQHPLVSLSSASSCLRLRPFLSFTSIHP